MVTTKVIKQIPCPRLDQLSDAALDQAVQDFDRIAQLKLRPACQAHCDPVRWEIDGAVMQMLDLPAGAKDAIEDLRLMWCREPSVHGNNKAAIKLLG